MVHSALYSINLEKIVLEKTRFNAIKSSIMYFFKCNCSLRIQNSNPKIWTSIFNYVLPLEHCVLEDLGILFSPDSEDLESEDLGIWVFVDLGSGEFVILPPSMGSKIFFILLFKVRFSEAIREI